MIPGRSWKSVTSSEAWAGVEQSLFQEDLAKAGSGYSACRGSCQRLCQSHSLGLSPRCAQPEARGCFEGDVTQFSFPNGLKHNCDSFIQLVHSDKKFYLDVSKPFLCSDDRYAIEFICRRVCACRPADWIPFCKHSISKWILLKKKNMELFLTDYSPLRAGSQRPSLSADCASGARLPSPGRCLCFSQTTAEGMLIHRLSALCLSL